MTTAPDHITSTAPKRIYLDLDGESPSIKPEDTFRDIEMRMGFTWSENCAMGHGIPYVRADLVPTPAASGAAPADRLKAAIDAIAPRFESANPIPVQKATVPVEEWTELLAALNAVIVALASPQVAPESDPHLWNVVKELREKGMGDMADRLELSSQAFVEDVYEQCAEAIRPLVDRGLLPGSVVESVQMMAANFALATPVQVAPPGFKLVPVEPTREMWEAVHKLDDRCAAGNHDGKGCSIEQAWECFLDNAPAAPGAKDQP